jgi:hypothetical protein
MVGALDSNAVLTTLSIETPSSPGISDFLSMNVTRCFQNFFIRPCSFFPMTTVVVAVAEVVIDEHAHCVS